MRSHVACVAALCLLGGMIAASQLSSAQAPARPAEAGVWQYKVVHLRDLVGHAGDIDSMVLALEKGLNGPGGEGWELSQEINGAVIFKRKR